MNKLSRGVLNFRNEKRYVLKQMAPFGLKSLAFPFNLKIRTYLPQKFKQKSRIKFNGKPTTIYKELFYREKQNYSPSGRHYLILWPPGLGF